MTVSMGVSEEDFHLWEQEGFLARDQNVPEADAWVHSRRANCFAVILMVSMLSWAVIIGLVLSLVFGVAR